MDPASSQECTDARTPDCTRHRLTSEFPSTKAQQMLCELLLPTIILIIANLMLTTSLAQRSLLWITLCTGCHCHVAPVFHTCFLALCSSSMMSAPPASSTAGPAAFLGLTLVVIPPTLWNSLFLSSPAPAVHPAANHLQA
jgi:hypothetical protein